MIVLRMILWHCIIYFSTDIVEMNTEIQEVYCTGYERNTKAKHSFVQRAPISKLKYLKGNQPSQNGPWQRLSHKAKKETRRTQGRQFHAALWES